MLLRILERPTPGLWQHGVTCQSAPPAGSGRVRNISGHVTGSKLSGRGALGLDFEHQIPETVELSH